MPTPPPALHAWLAGRRGYAMVLVVGLVGSLLAVVGTARPWASAAAAPPGLPTVHASVTGTDLEPVCGALGLALLAAFGAVLATRGRVRRGIGAAIVAGSVAVLVLAATAPADPTSALSADLSTKGWTGDGFASSTEPWRWIVVAAAVIAALAGVAVAWFGGGWASMGARYDAPAAAGQASRRDAAADDLTEAEVWKAIDQGRDPTQKD